MKQLSLNKKMDTPIAIRISKDNNFAKWIDQNKSISFNNIYTYGSINKVSGADVVINEKPDILAKAIHEVYRNGKGDQWENISIFKKDSCRAQADHLSAKLYLAGLRLTQKQDVKDDMKYISSEDEFQRIISPYIEELAILEHIRWNAFHFVNGWTVQDPLLEKDEINKKHYCLVDWEQLDMVSDIKKCNFKEYDREFIRNIYKYLEGTDYVICFLGESGDG